MSHVVLSMHIAPQADLASSMGRRMGLTAAVTDVGHLEPSKAVPAAIALSYLIETFIRAALPPEPHHSQPREE